MIIQIFGTKYAAYVGGFVGLFTAVVSTHRAGEDNRALGIRIEFRIRDFEPVAKHFLGAYIGNYFGHLVNERGFNNWSDEIIAGLFGGLLGSFIGHTIAPIFRWFNPRFIRFFNILYWFTLKNYSKLVVSEFLDDL